MMIPDHPMYTTNAWATYHWQHADDDGDWGEYLSVPSLRAEIRMERGGYHVTVQGVVAGVETALHYQTASLKDARGWGHMQLTLARRVARLEAAARAVVGDAQPDPATDPICWLDADAEAVQALQALLGDAPGG